VRRLVSRGLFGGRILAGAGALAIQRMRSAGLVIDRRKEHSRVAILHQGSYDESIEQKLLEGIRLFDLRLRGKTVLLKPNLVESLPGAEVNTNPKLVGAAVGAFRALGVAKVVVAEGPGHQRDTQLVLEETGLAAELNERRVRFVDLNRDEIVRRPLATHLTRLDHLWLPRTVLAADFVVSMPKVKTHHWAGVTLSMKNLFGVAPGIAYGWPKNLLHWAGIDRSILELNAAVPLHFVIADGIVGMEGNGPLNGAARNLGRVILADDPVAADFTCARLMGFNPFRVPHMAQAAEFLGNGAIERMVQLAEPMPHTVRPFAVLPEFAHLAQS
jgi:uncharacterized protein (DUF362 family)